MTTSIYNPYTSRHPLEVSPSTKGRFTHSAQCSCVPRCNTGVRLYDYLTSDGGHQVAIMIEDNPSIEPLCGSFRVNEARCLADSLNQAAVALDEQTYGYATTPPDLVPCDDLCDLGTRIAGFDFRIVGGQSVVAFSLTYPFYSDMVYSTEVELSASNARCVAGRLITLASEVEVRNFHQRINMPISSYSI